MDNELIKIRINGEDKEVGAHLSLSDLLDHFEIGRRGIAVELNRSIIPRGRHGEVTVADGDVVEIIRMVGGG